MGILKEFKKSKDREIIEKIKKSSNSDEIFDLIKSLKLAESIIEVFRIFKEHHMYDEFMDGKRIECNSIKNLYRLLNWDLLYNADDEYKYEILEYAAHRKGRADGYWELVGEIRSKKLREELLNLGYNNRPIEGDDEYHFNRILNEMEPEKRTDFFNNHNHRDKYILEFYVLFNDKTFRERYTSRVKELLVSERSESDDYSESDINCFLNNMDEETARDILNSCGDNLKSNRIRKCIDKLRLEFKDTEKFKEVLTKYKSRMNADDFNYVLMDYSKGFNCERKEMYITEFSDVMTQKTLQYIFEKYNYLLKESANSVQEYAKQNPHFLYNMAKTFYDVKLKDEKFKANEEDNNTDRVIQEIPLLDRIKFIEENKKLMPEISLCAIGEDEAKELGISKITDIILNHRNTISKAGIIRIMEELPPRMRLNFLKQYYFEDEVRNRIIEGIKKDPNNRRLLFDIMVYKGNGNTIDGEQQNNAIHEVGENDSNRLGISRITDIIAHHMDETPKDNIIRIMEELPPRMRLVFLEKFDFDAEVRRRIIERIKDDPKNTIPILELTRYENETRTEEPAK